MNAPARRPLYETPADMVREMAVRRIIEARWRIATVKTEQLCKVDYILGNLHPTTGFKAKAVAEIKCRDIPWGHFEDYRISHEKVEGALLEAKKWQAQPLLIVACRDRIGWLNMAIEPHLIAPLFGRTDRKDPRDLEQAAVYQWGQFVPLEFL